MSYQKPCVQGYVKNSSAVKICSGAPIPLYADAVVATEFFRKISKNEVSIRANAEPGRNIMDAGVEVTAGTVMIQRGERLLPDCLGLAAAAGLYEINVYRRPHVSLISIGDEIVAPGAKLHQGQLYASNLVTIAAWLTNFGISCQVSIAKDNESDILRILQQNQSGVDAILTSGGAWGSERDLIIGSLNKLDWQKFFITCV